jgi:hypothetical protein
VSDHRHPDYYNHGKIEVIEFVEDQQLGFHLGNCVKYVSRAGRKNPDTYVNDLQKAIWYLERAIEISKENPRRPNEMDPRWVSPSVCTNTKE